MSKSNKSHKRKREGPQVTVFSVYDSTKTIFRHGVDGAQSSMTAILTTQFSMEPRPKAKKRHVSEPEEPSSSTQQQTVPLPTTKLQSLSESREHHTYSQLLHDLKAYKEVVLEELMNMEWDKGIGSKCGCRNAMAEFHCKECANAQLLCSACTLAAHQYNPFHWIKQWNGEFFERTSLAALGYYLCLEHDGNRCPTTLPCDAKKITKHSSESGHAAYSHFAALRRLTDDISKDEVSDHYCEFLRVMRIWEHLQAEKYLGHTHMVSRYLSVAHKDTLAVLCLACPQPGIKTAPNWQTMAEKEIHRHSLFVKVDGNFSLDERKKKKDPSDRSLDAGRSFFVVKAPFDEFLKLAAPDLVAEEQFTIHGKELSVSDVTTLLADGFKLVEFQAKIKIQADTEKGHQSSSDMGNFGKTLIPSLASDYEALLEDLKDTTAPEKIELIFPSLFLLAKHSALGITEAASLKPGTVTP
ncbi:hypothetical protein M422DRAFT_776375 [Sphaerobolus stellatus SS14]|nr:hypothetical protein M422DRAFT_776375 [Sphaerobolus stellatus SS14]